MIKKLMRDESGQTMTEYILIIALVAVVCVASLKLFGQQIKALIVQSMQKIQKETKGFDK